LGTDMVCCPIAFPLCWQSTPLSIPSPPLNPGTGHLLGL
jgi:hypothetical protein